MSPSTLIVPASDPALAPASRSFAALDGIRGVAALIIVLAHSWMLYGIRLQETYLAVDLFFMLSGVVVANAYQARLEGSLSVARFCWIRIVRIYPLYILGIAILLLTMQSGLSPRITWLDPAQLGTVVLCAALVLPYLGSGSYLITPLNPPGWSLVFELFVNAVYAVIARWLSDRLLKAILLVSATGLIAIVMLRGAHSMDVGWHTQTFVGGFFRVSFPFFAGVLLLRRYRERERILRVSRDARITRPPARVMPWLMLLLVIAITAAAPGPRLQPFYDLGIVLLVFPALVYRALHLEPSAQAARVFRTLGILSYAVYAVHYPLTYLLMGLWESTTGIPVESFMPWGGFAVLALLLPICWWLVPNYDEPLRRWMLLRFKAKPRPPANDAVPVRSITDA